MPAILESLLSQHRDLRLLIALLERQPSLEPEPEAPHIGLLVDVLLYLTSFPDVSHHPVEDRIAERLLAGGALASDLVRELESQHALLAQQGKDLLRDLEGAMRKESMSLELVGLNSRLYAERLRHNIAFEELVLFPVAAKCLAPDDWRDIEFDHSPPADPLFSGQVDQRFAGLRRMISVEAKLPE
jgi:hemerythrin-like domain-containing protein